MYLRGRERLLPVHAFYLEGFAQAEKQFGRDLRLKLTELRLTYKKNYTNKAMRLVLTPLGKM